MRALTIWQPWASLIMVGAKPIEWRSWRAPRVHWNERLVIHAGTRKVQRIEVISLLQDCIREGRQLLAGVPVDQPTALDVEPALELLRAILDGQVDPPLAAGLGTALLREPKLPVDLGFGVDSDRLEHQNWGWPLADVELFAAPVPCKGARGFWTWPDAAEMARRAA